MSSLNQATLIGNLGRDPEIRRMQNGDAVANMSIATSERWRDKNTGEQREKTEWHRVVAFGKLAEIVEQYCKKGDRLFVQGQIQTRKWTDQSGADKYTTEIVLRGFNGRLLMLGGVSGEQGSSRDDAGRDAGHSGGYAGRREPDAQQQQSRAPDFDDEIPF